MKTEASAEAAPDTDGRIAKSAASDIHAPLIQPWPLTSSIGHTTLDPLNSGDGIYVWDKDGNRLIDGPAGMWCTNLGHRNTALARAMHDQALELSYNSPWYTTNDPATRFADLITQRAPGDLDHVFFTTGGSTAIETALRFVFFYNNVMGRPGRKLIVSRDDAYHGSTHLSAALNGRGHPAGAMDDTDPRVRHLPSPDPRNRRHGETEADFVRRLVGAFEDLIAEEGAETIAAFVGEPVMASGGVIVPPNGYFKAMSEACNRHGILFLADEVVTAFGRLGAVFASQEIFGVTPDLLTFAKGVTSGYFPLGGVLISARLIADLREAGANDAMFAHGLTYSSHPIGCAVAIRNLELLEAGVLDHVGAMIPHFQSRLAELRELPGVSDVRGLGLMACVEMKDGASPGDAAPIATEIDRHCQTLGLLVRPIGNLCVMSPPLIISAQQIDDLASILRTGISRATAGASFD